MKQKILCIADYVDPLVYSDSIKERFKDVDAVISCGDLKPNYYEYIVATLNIPFIYVLGNHSQFTLEKTLPGSFENENLSSRENLFDGGILADGRSIYIKKLDIIVLGLGGAKRYNSGGNQYTEREMMFRIIKLMPKLLFNRIFRGRYLDIFITHAPPRHINDREDPCHQGFKVFRWFLRKYKPLCMLHGHIHLYNNNSNRISCYKGVPVINTYKHFLLELPLKELEIE